MALYKSTNEIFSNPWDTSIKVAAHANNPISVPWGSSSLPSIDDIDLWEQIFYSPGSIGIYAAHNPMCEFYIITHDLYLSKTSVETYYGNGAADDVYERTKDLGIDIQLRKIWNATPSEA